MATMTGAQPTLADTLWPAWAEGRAIRWALLAVAALPLAWMVVRPIRP